MQSETQRRAVRRSVHLCCEVITSEWEEPAPHVVTDLSPYGCWVETSEPPAVGSHIVVAFEPPQWRGDEVVLFARVKHTRVHGSRPGMGLEFLDVSDALSSALRSSLAGLPPPLATSRARIRRQERDAVDAGISWREDLGDRINIFSVTEPFALDAPRSSTA